jgi:uncharacterized cupin superfamily protein
MATGGELMRLVFWMRRGASPPPLHVHPRREERVEVVTGPIRSISRGVERVVGSGEKISSARGVPHTVGPVGEDASR